MWEALTAIGSIASAVVIAVTVIVAARQVKVTTDQLEQTRRAAQFEATRSVLHEMTEPHFVEAWRFVAHDLAACLKDESFYRDVAEIGLAPYDVHKELYVLRAFDRVGTYVKYGLIDGEIVYSTFGPRIVICWDHLTEVVAIHRQVTNARFWQNAQFLYEDCKQWAAANVGSLDGLAMMKRQADFKARASEDGARRV